MAEMRSGEEIPLGDSLDEAVRRLDSFEGPVDAIIGFWDFPVSIMVPILCQRLDALCCASLGAVVKCEHKYWSRLEQQKVIEEYPRFGLFDPERDTELPHRQALTGSRPSGLCGIGTTGVVRRRPTEQEIERVQREMPGVTVDVTVKEGDRLSELIGQDSYCYCIANIYLAAQDEAAATNPQRLRRRRSKGRDLAGAYCATQHNAVLCRAAYALGQSSPLGPCTGSWSGACSGSWSGS